MTLKDFVPLVVLGDMVPVSLILLAEMLLKNAWATAIKDQAIVHPSVEQVGSAAGKDNAMNCFRKRTTALTNS